MHLEALVLAAGLSKRFPGEKMLFEVEGVPMVGRVVKALHESGIFRAIKVITRPDLERRIKGIVEKYDASILVNPNPSGGISESIKVGVESSPKGSHLAITLGDLPFLKPETIRFLGKTYILLGKRPLYPRYKGKRGHPFFVPREIAKKWLEGIKGDRGFRDFPSIPIDVQDPGICRDMDRKPKFC